ncbi:MAG TPA: DUF3658 domain-containing protein [Woeseiaceae bacterium]|nr:DUF3658 domain-containing protein [Woeseiaceae bacterium]
MKKSAALNIIDRLTNMHVAMNDVIRAIEEIEEESEKKDMRRAVAELMGRSYTELLAPILQQYPELDPDADPHDVEPDGPLSPSQLAMVEKLTDEQIEDIDNSLLESCPDRWRKVAAVVGITMTRYMKDKYPGVPDIFYAQRVRALVEKGILESSGNLDYMRYSEVRLAKDKSES